MPGRCTLEGCDNEIGDGLSLMQSGLEIGGICEDCLGSAKGGKILVRKNEEGEFTIEEYHRIENPL